ncbi:MAG: CCA tRNA nucleotidyltransferase [Chthoniobacterales bacterium]
MELTARKIAKHLQDAGHTAYFAGGCVRDHLLGLTPHDFDIATSALPEEVQRLFPRTVPVGAQFGVILVIDHGMEFQVATFRSDGAYIDGRHPAAVSFSTAESDTERRDFTINGLFYDPASDSILDFVGGQEDLKRRLLRAIGNPNDRFEEDKLRILRAIRFSTTLGFEIDPATWEAVCANSAKIHSVSAERIQDEVVKLFLSPHRVRGFDQLDQSGLLREILPEVDALKGCEQPPQFHPEGDVFIHTRLMLSLLPEKVSLPLVLAVLFHDIGKLPTQMRDATGRIRFNGHEYVSAEMTLKIMQRLRFSNDITDATIEQVRHHMAFKDVQQMRTAKLKRFMARPTFEDEMELHRVDCSGSHGMLDNYHFLHQKQEEFANEPLVPPPLVTGKDLIQLGMQPGPAFSSILENVQTAQLEGTLKNREQALEWIRQQFLQGGAQQQ